MSDVTENILRHIPSLRRYARVLTGSQKDGDEYVRVCLEKLVESPERIGSENTRFQLFSMFHKACGDVAPPGGAPGRKPSPDLKERIDHQLAVLPPIERQVLLLVALEEFSYAETAAILGISEQQATKYLAEAREEIRRQTSVPILIIEDEPMIAMEISRIVDEMGHTVCGTAARHADAVALAAKSHPALVLADIQLKDGDSGISAVQEILQNWSVPIIFVTGYPERLLTGERVEPAFVISKPFVPEMLKAAIAQALSVGSASA